jgi:pyruvate dehydrogenase E1 component alpha subunit
MAAHKVDGCDFFATHNLMEEVIAYCRAGKGPVAVEFDTERFYGHFEGDPQRYRAPGEVERLRTTRDCLAAFRAKALDDGSLDARTLDALDVEVRSLINTAVEEARVAPVPTAADVLEDVYVSY